MQINNTSYMLPAKTAPNFKMALKILPEAKEALIKSKPEVLTELRNAGELLKDTKHCHLEIGKDLKYTIDTGYAYKLQDITNMYPYLGKGLINYNASFTYKPNNSHGNRQFANNLENYTVPESKGIYTITDAAEFTKALDNAAIKEEAKAAKKYQEELQHLNDVATIMDDFKP